MKTTFAASLALLLISASAISVADKPDTQTPEDYSGYDQGVYDEGDFMLTTYIGFEFPGDELADIFSSFEDEEQREISLMV